MAAITSAGVGSGLDIETLVTQLMEVERVPLTNLQEQQSEIEAQISAYGKLSSAVATFRGSLTSLDTLNDFKAFNATSSNESAFTATTSISATPSTYSVEVTRIAERHKMQANTTYADKDTTQLGVGGDKMTIQVGTDSFDVVFGGQTLEQVRDAINGAADNTGVNASIIKADGATPYRLFLTGDETGSDNFIQVSYGIDPFQLEAEEGGGSTLTGTSFYSDSNTTAIGRAGDIITINGTNVDIGNKTLDQIRDDINTASIPGVTASVEDTEDGYTLKLSSGGAMTVSYTPNDVSVIQNLTDFNSTNDDRDTSGSFDAADLDAVFKVEGLDVTRSRNNVSDVIEGVTLNLVGPTTAEETLTITRDTSSIQENVQGFVDAYNTFQDTLDELGYDELKNDQSLRSVSSQVRNLLNTAASDLNYSYMSEVGVSFTLENKEQPDGTVIKVSRLELNASTLSSALISNFSDVADVFGNNDQGFGYRLDNLLEDFVKPDGFLDTRTDGMNSEIVRLQDREEDLQVRLDLQELRYRQQFGALDILVATMRQTGTFLTQQLESLPKVGDNN